MPKLITPQPAPITTAPQAVVDEAANVGHEPPSPTQVDKLTAVTGMAAEGASAATPTKAELATTIKDASDVIEYSFLWMNEAAQVELDTLKSHLKKVDDPPFVEQLIKSALGVALGAGAAAAGELVAGKVLGKLVEGMEPFHELVKGMFEQGINAGINAGQQMINASGSDVIASFIASQKKAVYAAQMENQTRFIETGRHKLRTVHEAQTLKDGCDQPTMDLAGIRQYQATRDAWIGYLAQSELGSVERAGSVPTKVTNMTTRDDSEDVALAAYGLAPGVLEVVAELPTINLERKSMTGRPRVMVAFLNGVNATIREQYAGQPLSSMKIPRHVVARVDGPFDFSINLDEAGNLGTLTGKQTWLRSRAFVGNPRNTTWGEEEREREGVRLLLEELIPSEIKAKL